MHPGRADVSVKSSRSRRSPRAPLVARPGLLGVGLASLVGLATLFPTGCVEIHGGAIEVAWVIFDPGGRAIRDCACTEPPISQVRLDLASTTDGSNPCASASSCRFTCTHQTGSTPFEIPPGEYTMSLTALGADGSALGTALGFRSTPPTLWPVVRGQPTEVDAVAIEAPCSDLCNGQSSTSPCDRP
jgi:hypothetical protein